MPEASIVDLPAPRRGGARQRLLTALTEALVERVGDFEIADVARRASVSVGLAYHHFGSKAGLLAALIDDFHDRHDAVANQRLDGALPWAERERARLEATIVFMYADPLAAVLMGPLSGSAEAMAVEAARRRAMVELAAHNIAHGQRMGFIDPAIDPTLAGAAIMGGIRQAVATALSSPTPPPKERVIAQIWAFIAGGLGLPTEDSRDG
ncbi:TetR/AcrR family transcriptional regulator [Caulobacter mirabilis]|uniref:TetR/AcrR family transcriptional regulator n=1 Tax=Caulobacter mirabilis TaxID=69666 RepID=UPI0015595A78|nr:TetR/AcrR family transcriptional regulator [Caulobacter mirabilis]